MITPPQAKDVPQRAGSETEKIEKCGSYIRQSPVAITGAEDEGGWQREAAANVVTRKTGTGSVKVGFPEFMGRSLTKLH